MPNAIFKDLGLIQYKKAWEYQEEIHSSLVSAKISNLPNYNNMPEYLLFCEHPNVYTLGKSGNDQNLLIDYIQLQAKNAEFFHTNRGGDITYHGPGQIVGYPIIDLDKHKLGVKTYIFQLEESIIDLLKDYDIQAERLEGATGVWLDTQKQGMTRKICAIGVRVSRSITMHGFAFNVNTDLKYFDYINPCGFTDKGVTSLANELGYDLNFEIVKQQLKEKLAKNLNLNFIDSEN
ncbi:MAG: lipoyl(octanoyl) transferase LipB [Candidatus Kapaibacteriota bacterium]